MSYGDAEAVTKAAEDAAARAEDAAATAESAAGANLSNAASRAAVMSTNIPSSVTYIRTTGYASAGDGGGALYKRVTVPSRGPNLVVNSAFSSSSGWTLGAGWVILGGAGSREAIGSPTDMRQNIPIIAGKLYRSSYRVTSISIGTTGGVRLDLGGGAVTTGTLRTTVGSFTEYIIAQPGNTDVRVSVNSGVSVTVDDVVLQEVIGGANVQSADGAWWGCLPPTWTQSQLARLAPVT